MILFAVRKNIDIVCSLIFFLTANNINILAHCKQYQYSCSLQKISILLLTANNINIFAIFAFLFCNFSANKKYFHIIRILDSSVQYSVPCTFASPLIISKPQKNIFFRLPTHCGQWQFYGKYENPENPTESESGFFLLQMSISPWLSKECHGSLAICSIFNISIYFFFQIFFI